MSSKTVQGQQVLRGGNGGGISAAFGFGATKEVAVADRGQYAISIEQLTSLIGRSYRNAREEPVQRAPSSRGVTAA